MIISSALFFFVAGTISVVTGANITYTRDASTGQLDLAYGQECVQPGQMCEDCQKVVYCVELSGGDFIKHDMYDCSSGQTCLNTKNDCAVEPNPMCDDVPSTYKFVCHQTGMFPDAEDCTKYHICVSKEIGKLPAIPEPFSGQCEAGYTYDPKTSLCRNRINFIQCERVVPVCSVAGETGVIPNSPSYYYICLRLNGSGAYFPQMFKCPKNHEFFNGVCVDPSPLQSVDVIDGYCTKNGLFVHPTSCSHYYGCALGLPPIINECAPKKMFDYRTLSCIDIKCQNF